MHFLVKGSIFDHSSINNTGTIFDHPSITFDH